MTQINIKKRNATLRYIFVTFRQKCNIKKKVNKNLEYTKKKNKKGHLGIRLAALLFTRLSEIKTISALRYSLLLPFAQDNICIELPLGTN